MHYSIDFADIFADHKIVPVCDLTDLQTLPTKSVDIQLKQFIEKHQLKLYVVPSLDDLPAAISHVQGLLAQPFLTLFESDNLARIASVYNQITNTDIAILISRVVQTKIEYIMTDEKDIITIPPLLAHLPMRFVTTGVHREPEFQLLPFFDMVYDFAWKLSLMHKPTEWFIHQCVGFVNELESKMATWTRKTDTTWSSLRVYTLSLFRITYPGLLPDVVNLNDTDYKKYVKLFKQ